MERAAKLVKKATSSQNVFTDDDFARAVWPAAVGKAIAARTSRVKLVRNTLVVEVEDTIWQKQLYPLTRQILERIVKVTGGELIRDIEFRVAVPRRQPARAEVPDSLLTPAAVAHDEADAIRDPVLKKIYRLSRKRATA